MQSPLLWPAFSSNSIKIQQITPERAFSIYRSGTTSFFFFLNQPSPPCQFLNPLMSPFPTLHPVPCQMICFKILCSRCPRLHSPPPALSPPPSLSVPCRLFSLDSCSTLHPCDLSTHPYWYFRNAVNQASTIPRTSGARCLPQRQSNGNHGLKVLLWLASLIFWSLLYYSSTKPRPLLPHSHCICHSLWEMLPLKPHNAHSLTPSGACSNAAFLIGSIQQYPLKYISSWPPNVGSWFGKYDSDWGIFPRKDHQLCNVQLIRRIWVLKCGAE